jgi:hypothetical protein
MRFICLNKFQAARLPIRISRSHKNSFTFAALQLLVIWARNSCDLVLAHLKKKEKRKKKENITSSKYNMLVVLT